MASIALGAVAAARAQSGPRMELSIGAPSGTHVELVSSHGARWSWDVAEGSGAWRETTDAAAGTWILHAAPTTEPRRSRSAEPPSIAAALDAAARLPLTAPEELHVQLEGDEVRMAVSRLLGRWHVRIERAASPGVVLAREEGTCAWRLTNGSPREIRARAIGGAVEGDVECRAESGWRAARRATVTFDVVDAGGAVSDLAIAPHGSVCVAVDPTLELGPRGACGALRSSVAVVVDVGTGGLETMPANIGVYETQTIVRALGAVP